MIKIGEIYIDGTKIKAHAANRRTKTKEEYEKWEKKIDDKIDKILREADEIDRQEDEMYGDKRGDELPEDIDTEAKLEKKLKEVKKKFKRDKEKINLTDPDAHFMKGGDGRIDVGYNCQAAVTDDQIIVSSEVIQDANDRNALELMVETTEENTKEEVKEIAADTGYSSYENYEYLSKKNKIGYIPDQQMREQENRDSRYNRYHLDNFTYDRDRDEYICPEGHRLPRYKVRRKDESYRKWRQVIYKGTACLDCTNRDLCTKQRYRTIARDDRKELLDQMRDRLKSEEGCKKYIKRLYTVEPIFGHFKFNLGYRQFLCLCDHWQCSSESVFPDGREAHLFFSFFSSSSGTHKGPLQIFVYNVNKLVSLPYLRPSFASFLFYEDKCRCMYWKYVSRTGLKSK